MKNWEVDSAMLLLPLHDLLLYYSWTWFRACEDALVQ